MVTLKSRLASRFMSTFRVTPPRGLVACNVYISAGEPKHFTLVQSLLKRAQHQSDPIERYLKHRHSTPNHPDGMCDDCPDREKAAVVVATYCDPVYNRSSFHLAGHADRVTEVAIELAVNAARGIRPRHMSKSAYARSDHPYIGRVDHVSVMPLLVSAEKAMAIEKRDNIVEAGEAAKKIGEAMKKELGIDIFYYGAAHPDVISLAQVRREKTMFFKSGSLSPADTKADKDDENNNDALPNPTEAACVGAPLEFVQNYNVRLGKRCTKQMAQSLAKKLRERDGGLDGVEALTLPYSFVRWEVACNLLRPDSGGAQEKDIDRICDEWERDQGIVGMVESKYRVGTTSLMCLYALEVAENTVTGRKEWDAEAMRDLYAYFRYGGSEDFTARPLFEETDLMPENVEEDDVDDSDEDDYFDFEGNKPLSEKDLVEAFRKENANDNDATEEEMLRK